MGLRLLVPMTTLPTANEQSAAVPAVITATGVSREYPELSSFTRAIFIADVSAVAGTLPTLDIVIQGYDVLSGKWHAVATFPQQTTTTATVLAPIAATLDYQAYRAQWTIGGTGSPSFTFTLTCYAYAEEATA